MTTTEPDRLPLDEFVLKMMYIPSKDLTMEQLNDLVQRLDLGETLIREHINFSEEAYARNLICRTPRFDMLALCWRPGQVTSIHDHVNCLNVTRVFQGELTSRDFEVHERPSEDRAILRQIGEDRLGMGDIGMVTRTGIHQLANTSDADLITIHVYAPPLKDITVYYPNSGRFERVALRYTLEDEFA